MTSSTVHKSVNNSEWKEKLLSSDYIIEKLEVTFAASSLQKFQKNMFAHKQNSLSCTKPHVSPK